MWRLSVEKDIHPVCCRERRKRVRMVFFEEKCFKAPVYDAVTEFCNTVFLLNDTVQIPLTIAFAIIVDCILLEYYLERSDCCFMGAVEIQVS